MLKNALGLNTVSSILSGLYSRILKLFPTVSSLAPASTRPVQQGQVCEFDGVDDYVLLSESIGVDFSGSCWIKFDEITTQQGIYNHGGAVSHGYVYISGGALRIIGGSSVVFAQSAGTVTAGVWHFIEWELVENSHLICWVDGVASPSVSLGSCRPASSARSIGTHYSRTTNWLNGSVSNFVINDNQYNLNHASGTTAYDSSGNGNHGTLQNGAAFVVDNTLPPEADKLNLEGFSRRMLFDGVNDFVDLGASFLNVSGAEIRITAKIEVGGNPRVIVSQGGATGGWVVNTDTNNKLRIVIKQNGSTSTYRTILSSVVLSEGQIYDIDVKFSQDTATVIINGVEDASVNIGSPVGVYGDSVSNVFIGARGDNSLWWEGLIFDCNLYLDDVLLSSYNGYGNTDANWTDQIGSNNGTVNGSPENLLLPRDESDPANDIDGNPLQYSGSVYPRRPEYRDSYCGKPDGVDDRIDGHTDVLTRTNNITYLKFKVTKAAGKITYLVNHSHAGNGGSGFGPRLRVYHDAMELRIFGNTGTYPYWDITDDFFDQWNTLAVRWKIDVANVEMSLNGSAWRGVDSVGIPIGDWGQARTRYWSFAGHTDSSVLELGEVALYSDETDYDNGDAAYRHVFGEGVGAALHDVSGNNRPATLVNATTATEGAGFWAGRIDGEENALNNNNGFSKRMLFDGVDDYVNLGNSADFDFTNNIDITLHALIDDNTNSHEFVGKGTGTTTNWNIDYNSGIRFFGYESTVLKGITASAPTLTNNTKAKIRCTFNGTTWKIYVDDVEVRSVTDACTLTTNSNNVLVGERGSVSLSGTMYDISINGVATYTGNGNTDADWTDQIGSNDGTVNGSPALLRIPADTSDPTKDVYGDTLTNPAITDGYNGAETELDAYNIAEGDNPSPETNNNPDLESIEFGADFASNDAAYMRLKSSTENDRLITFADDLTGDDKELVEKFTETP